MPQSLVKILVHVVFSTKNRVDIITPEIEPRLYGYIAGICENHGSKMIIAGGTATTNTCCSRSATTMSAI